MAHILPRLRDMAIRLRVLRDERIKTVLHEARTVITRENRRSNVRGNGDDHGETRSFHDSPHR